jgi:hypothetical protein
MKNSIQIIGFLILCAVLFGFYKKKPEIHVKVIERVVYRDTSDSEFMRKIAQLETGGNDSLSGDGGRGRGRFGIYDVCLTGTGFKDLLNLDHADMHNREAATAVFWAMMGIFMHLHYSEHGKFPTFEELARKWAGGPNGETKKATLKYLEKFRSL